MRLFKSKRQRQLESISNLMDDISEGVDDLQHNTDEMIRLCQECLVICDRVIGCSNNTEVVLLKGKIIRPIDKE